MVSAASCYLKTSCGKFSNTTFNSTADFSCCLMQNMFPYSYKYVYKFNCSPYSLHQKLGQLSNLGYCTCVLTIALKTQS